MFIKNAPLHFLVLDHLCTSTVHVNEHSRELELLQASQIPSQALAVNAF